jgi:tetratricopeptide (TPR) repeat protein
VPSAGGQDGRAAGADRVQLTAGKIHESFGERQTPSQLHAFGISQLLSGHYDDAAQALRAASREQPANAQYLSDVAAVQLERARLGLRPDDLPRALAAADRARRLDPSLREAWFNRALAASALSLTAEAKAAWAEYLKRDSSSPWATEARARLAELTKPTPAEAWPAIEGRLEQSIDASTADEAVRAHTTESRRYIENELLPAWADAVLAGRTASNELNRVRLMADAMLRVAGDGLYRDVVSMIDRTPAADLRALARAHRQYADAAIVYGNDDFNGALPLMRDAAQSLQAAGSPYSIRPTLDLASMLYLSGRYDQVAAMLLEVLATARAHHYAFAEARATWVQGLSAFAQGRLADAQTHYEDTLAALERMGDAEQVSAAHMLLAGLFYYLGDETQQWAQFTPALHGLDVTRSPKLRHGLLISAAMFVRRSTPETALAIGDEAVRNAEQWGQQGAIAEVLALRAAILTDLERSDDAAADLTSARQHLAASTDQASKARVEITVLATEGQLLRATNPAAAVEASKRAIALVQARKDRARLPQLQLELAKANIVWGRTSDAEAALEQGIRAFDLENASLRGEFQISSRDQAWGLFETAVHLAIKKQDYDRAFALAERARVRSLAEARRFPATRTLAQIQNALGASDAIVALNQFDDELAIWVIRHNSTDVVTRKLTRGAAEQLVARQQNDVWLETSGAGSGRALYTELLRPVSAQLANITRLIVVPDTTYENVSFAALVNPSTNRFLVEQLSVSAAPSANAYAAALEHAHVNLVSQPLVVGGANDRAINEARAVAAAYASPSLMIGNAATRENFFANAPSGSMVHLAVPVSVSALNPLLSMAHVADEPGIRHSGTLLGSDIAASTLPNTGLVVVDEVRDNSTNRGEGTLSMARAFMAAGVPAVLGTLPGANEDAIRDLMIGFHREMSKGMSAEQALQTVQRNAVQSNGRRVGAWSALVLYGSDR